MSNKYNEHEEVIGKAYDSKLMKRLLKYAKPYKLLLVTALILMLILTGLDLLKPYLIKISIDEYLNGYRKAMYEIEVSQPYDGVLFNNKKYVRLDSLSYKEKERLSTYPQKKIIKDRNSYYLIGIDEEIESGIRLSKEEYRAFRKQDIDGLTKIGIIFAVVIILTFVFNYFQVYLLNYASQKIIFNIRQEVFSHIIRLSTSYFDNNPIGRLVTRVTNDVETLNEMYTSVLVSLLNDIFILGGIVLIMLKMNLKLALISFALVPLILAISVVFRKKIRKIYRLGRTQLAKINSTLNENISGIKTIQIFNKEKKDI